MKTQPSESHREQYAQFVTEQLKKLIRSNFTAQELKDHFNSVMFDSSYIPIRQWDSIAAFGNRKSFSCNRLYVPNWNLLGININKLRETNTGLTQATAISIIKEAARQVNEENENI